METSWEEIYKKRGKVQSKVKQIVKDLLEFKKEGKVLDVGCGTGRHARFLVENGFEVYAGDVSETAVKITSEIKEIKVSVFSKEKLPFDNESFDVILITNVLSHSLVKDILKSVSEIDRVLKVGGLVVISDLSTKDSFFGKGDRVEENSFKNIPGLLTGRVHHFFTKEELLNLFKTYKVLKYYTAPSSVFTELHNFILEKV